MSNIDEQIKKAEEKVKRLKERKLLNDSKKAIAENESLKAKNKSLSAALKNREAENLANAREYKTVIDSVKKLYDDLQQNKFFSLNYDDKKNQKKYSMIKAVDVQKRLRQIIDLQK